MCSYSYKVWVHGGSSETLLERNVNNNEVTGSKSTQIMLCSEDHNKDMFKYKTSEKVSVANKVNVPKIINNESDLVTSDLSNVKGNMNKYRNCVVLNKFNHESADKETLDVIRRLDQLILNDDSRLLTCGNSVLSRYSQQSSKCQSTTDLALCNGSDKSLNDEPAKATAYRRTVSHNNAPPSHSTEAPLGVSEHPALNDEQVRSRSLTHLDSLDPAMLVKQTSSAGNPPKLNGELPLKDSRSDPDCAGSSTERLLYVPEPAVGTIRTTPEMPFGPAVGHSSSFRRQKLARSQVSSSEYFSVAFELNDSANIGLNQTREEFIPAVKGVLLSDALSLACDRHSVDLNLCAVYLDAPQTTLSPHSTDTSWLAGKHLRITTKDVLRKSPHQNHPSLHKSVSASCRGRQARFFSSSTEDAAGAGPGPETEGRVKGRQRWSGFFSNNKDTKMEQLSELLNSFSRCGVPTTHLTGLAVDSNAEAALHDLEEHWQDVVDPTGMTEAERQFQTAIWELFTTEAAYIKTLRVVTDLFLACLESLQQSNILTEIDQNKLFSNITDICRSNLQFWTRHLYPSLRISRDTGRPLQCDGFLEGFIRFQEAFAPYVRYCSEQGACQYYCREMNAQNEVFTGYLAWCETRKECNRLRLADILVRPMQRLTKYSLLLQAARKHAPEAQDWEALDSMIHSVDDFVAGVNATLRQRQESERLKGIMARIDSYEAVESKDDELEKLVRAHSELDLGAPMAGCSPCRQRHLLMEGDLRLRDAASKVDVHCFLLTDMLLVCKPSTKRGGATVKVIRQPYLTDRLVVKELSREPPTLACIYLNEYKMAVGAFTLQCSESKVLKSWSDCLKKANHLYTQCKLHHPSHSHHNNPSHQWAGPGLPDQWSVATGGQSQEYDQSLSCDLDYDSHTGVMGVPVGGAIGGSLAQRSPLAGSSRGSRVSSLAHSHSGSVEMNESISSLNPTSRNISIEQDLRTTSISSDEGIPPLNQETSPKGSVHEGPVKYAPMLAKVSSGLKGRPKGRQTPNTLSVQPFSSLGQSLPNLTITTMQSGSLRRGFAFSAQNKNPPLIKTRHITSHSVSMTGGPGTPPTIGPPVSSGPLSAPIISSSSQSTAGLFSTALSTFGGVTISREPPGGLGTVNVPLVNNYIQGEMARATRLSRRHYTTGYLLDKRKNDTRDVNAFRRFSWNIEYSCRNADRCIPAPMSYSSTCAKRKSETPSCFIFDEKMAASGNCHNYNMETISDQTNDSNMNLLRTIDGLDAVNKDECSA